MNPLIFLGLSACSQNDKEVLSENSLTQENEVTPQIDQEQTQENRPDPNLFPLFTQEGYVCAVASTLVAWYILDRTENNPRKLLSALDIIEQNDNKKIELKRKLETQGITSFDDNDFKYLSMEIYNKFNKDGILGLKNLERSNAMKALGVDTTKTYELFGGGEHVREIFSSSIIRNLTANKFAQVTFTVSSSLMAHSFLIGKLTNENYFIYDQAPGHYIEAQTLEKLQEILIEDIQNGFYWLNMRISPTSTAEGLGIIKLN